MFDRKMCIVVGTLKDIERCKHELFSEIPGYSDHRGDTGLVSSCYEAGMWMAHLAYEDPSLPRILIIVLSSAFEFCLGAQGLYQRYRREEDHHFFPLEDAPRRSIISLSSYLYVPDREKEAKTYLWEKCVHLGWSGGDPRESNAAALDWLAYNAGHFEAKIIAMDGVINKKIPSSTLCSDYDSVREQIIQFYSS
jgi:hypothetical protein